LLGITKSIGDHKYDYTTEKKVPPGSAKREKKKPKNLVYRVNTGRGGMHRNQGQREIPIFESGIQSLATYKIQRGTGKKGAEMEGKRSGMDIRRAPPPSGDSRARLVGR